MTETGKTGKEVKMEKERRVRCNHCMSTFYEEYLEDYINGKNEDAERCPVCKKSDALMDITECGLVRKYSR